MRILGRRRGRIGVFSGWWSRNGTICVEVLGGFNGNLGAMEIRNWYFQQLVELDWPFFSARKIVLRLLVTQLYLVLCTRVWRRLRFRIM